LLLSITVAVPSIAGAQRPTTDYRVLATSKTSTMLKEMQQPTRGTGSSAVMGGETSFGGNEVVVLMQKTGPAERRFAYRLLAASKTSTMQRELQDAADAGFEGQQDFEALGMTVGETASAGGELVVITRRPVG
jgi:hypothetical protein